MRSNELQLRIVARTQGHEGQLFEGQFWTQAESETAKYESITPPQVLSGSVSFSCFIAEAVARTAKRTMITAARMVLQDRVMKTTRGRQNMENEKMKAHSSQNYSICVAGEMSSIYNTIGNRDHSHKFA